MPFLHTTSDVSTFKFFQFVAVRSFTADSSLLQPTGSVNTTPHTSHFFTDSHAHAWLKLRVCRAHIMCHPHVFVLTLFDSTFLSLLTIFSLIILSFLLPINFIFHDVVDKFPCSLSDEDLVTLAEYDPLTECSQQDHFCIFIESQKFRSTKGKAKTHQDDIADRGRISISHLQHGAQIDSHTDSNDNS